jgi:hypothetical protein
MTVHLMTTMSKMTCQVLEGLSDNSRDADDSIRREPAQNDVRQEEGKTEVGKRKGCGSK